MLLSTPTCRWTWATMVAVFGLSTPTWSFQEVSSRKLSLPFPAGGLATTARSGQLDPSESHFIFTVSETSDYDGPPVEALYTVPVAGGEPVELFRFERFQGAGVGFGGDRVAWTVGTPGNVPRDLYSAPVDGSEEPILLATLPRDSAIHIRFGGTPGMAFYTEELGSETRLVALPLDGQSPPEVIFTSDDFLFFDLEPSGRFLSIQTNSETLFATIRLWPLDGSSPPNLISGDIATTTGRFQVTPNGRFVAFESVPTGPEGLFFAPTDGSFTPLPFHRPLAPDREVEAFEIDPEGRFVAYIETGGGQPGVLYSVDFAAGGTIRELSAGLEVGSFLRFAPRGRDRPSSKPGLRETASTPSSVSRLSPAPRPSWRAPR